jgi:hypothetical protein
VSQYGLFLQVRNPWPGRRFSAADFGPRRRLFRGAPPDNFSLPFLAPAAGWKRRAAAPKNGRAPRRAGNEKPAPLTACARAAARGMRTTRKRRAAGRRFRAK